MWSSVGRLSKRDTRSLEALEGAAGVLGVSLRFDHQLLEIRLGDLRRRLPEYRRLIGLAEDALETCETHRDRAHGLVAEVLEVWQRERSEA